MTEIVLVLTGVAAVLGLVAYMLAQKGETAPQKLIHQGLFEAAVKSADELIGRGTSDSALHLHKAEALKLLGRFEEAIASYRVQLLIDPRDAAAREGIALCLTYLGRDLQEARRLMDEALMQFPQIQEFQAMSLAFVDKARGDNASASRLFEDNAELVRTRFEIDYTDRDPLLVEALYVFGELVAAYGRGEDAERYFRRIVDWAPTSVFALWVGNRAITPSSVVHSEKTGKAGIDEKIDIAE